MKRIGPILIVVGVALIGGALIARGDESEPGKPSSNSLQGRVISLLQPGKRAPKPAEPEPKPQAEPKERCSSDSPEACKVIAEENGDDPRAETFWGAVECDLDKEPAAVSGQRRVARGGDARPTATGRPQGNESYREIVTHDGDRFFGERCELGRNDYNVKPNTAFYREGDHFLTFTSVLLPDDFPVGTDSSFQGVLQMKQTQPSDVGVEAPAIAMGAYQDRWQLFSAQAVPGTGEVNDRVIWSTPAGTGTWTRFIFDVVYSADPERGMLKVYVDLNGDRDFDDEGEQSPEFGDDEPMATLRAETGVASEGDPLPPGSPVPSHLRAGLYHAPDIECPARGCRVGIDNVQIARARGD